MLSFADLRHAVNVSDASLMTRLAETNSDAALRLMEAAANAFAEKGFPATTTRDIASRAGLSPAGVYVHFSSKEELLFQLSKHGHEIARDLLAEAASAANSPTEALRDIASGFAQWHAEHYVMGRIVQFEFRHLTDEHRDVVLNLRKEIDRVVRTVLADGVATGEFDVDDVPGTALAILSLAVDVARWYSPEITRTPEVIGRSTGDFALRLVRAH